MNSTQLKEVPFCVMRPIATDIDFVQETVIQRCLVVKIWASDVLRIFDKKELHFEM